MGLNGAECLTTSSSVTGRLSFLVTVIDTATYAAQPGESLFFTQEKMCLCLSHFQGAAAWLLRSSVRKTHTFSSKPFWCDTCYEVTARRGLRNNPSKINISKPHLCVWLTSNLWILFFVFFFSSPQRTIDAKPHAIAFTQSLLCVYTEWHISNDIIVLANQRLYTHAFEVTHYTQIINTSRLAFCSH